MDRLKAEDLAPSMRLDESLHLTSGELVLYRRQAVDELLLDALAASGVAELALATSPAEVEGLALGADREAVPTAKISERTVFAWGLYDAAGRKVLSAHRCLTRHRAWALRSAGIDVLLEPASDLAATVARHRRILLRRRASRPGRPPAAASRTIGGGAAAGGGAPRGAPIATGETAESTLAVAMLASEAETLIRQLAVGISLDVPGTLEAARSAVVDTFARPFASAACAVGMLASGKLRERAAASAVIAVASARAAAWREDECLELAAAALLHESPYPWLAEGRGPADSGSTQKTAATRIAGERAPVRAHMLLADADGLAPEIPLTVLQTYERPDGSGRPFGLAAEEILPGARLLAVTNVFSGAVSPGGEGPALSAHEAMKRCVEFAGEGLLDGDAVRALLRAVGYYPVGSSVRLSTGELAQVVATSEAHERPVVSVTMTRAGLPPAERRAGMERIIDLSRLTGIHIEGPVPP